MSIPLAKDNSKDSINTSIIAIKRQIERINALLGLSNSEEIDTSVFATKTELEDAVTQVETDLAPVDEVTADNMHSVTSNAVAEAFGYLLWENPDSTQGLARYDITYNLPNGYKKLLVEVKLTQTAAWRFLTLVSIDGNDYLSKVWVNSRGLFQLATRVIENITNQGCSITQGRYFTITDGYLVDNTYCVPTRIWAIK